MPGRVILALSPLPSLLVQAARCHGLWREIRVVGRKHVHPFMDECLQAGEPAELLLLLREVDAPTELGRRFAAFGRLGGLIQVFAPRDSPSVRAACRGLEHVRLHTASSVEEAFERVYPGHNLYGDLSNPDLRDYLQYKITICFMRLMDPQPLEEAAQALYANGERIFSLARAVPEEAGSVEHFREADFPYIEGQSRPVLELKRRIREVGASSLNVLLLGETGTGKEFAAFYLHEFSPRRHGPFVAINCAGLNETFLRSELFGHLKGSFTGAVAENRGLVHQAEGGTLFLDELAEMPLPVQADLLRFLQSRRYRPLGAAKERKADVRIIAGTQPVLREKLRRGEFREDLYYRLAEVEIPTPPLAAIPEDIPRIIRHVCYRMADRMRDGADPRDVIQYFRRGERTLKKYPWPGNVRELISLVRRRVELGDDVVAELKERMERKLSEANPAVAVEGVGAASAPPGFSRIEPLKTIVARYVQWAHARRGALSQQDLARRLGISVNTLKKHLAAAARGVVN